MGYAHERPFDLVHDRLPYQGAMGRAPSKWPNGKRVAVWIVPNVEHYEYLPLPAEVNPWPRTPHPDIRKFSYHDYGNRVALWRFFELFDRYEIPATVSLNLSVLDHYPQIREAMIERQWAFMGHGIYNTRYVVGLSREQELDMLHQCNTIALRYLERPLRGMLGPFITANEWTPDIMAEVGMDYHVDWVHDDFPSPLRTSKGWMVALPYTYELNDGPLMRAHVEADEFAQRCIDQFDRLNWESERDGRARMMSIALHPFAMGQPHRIAAMENIFQHLRGQDAAWLTTADEIVDFYKAGQMQVDVNGAGE